MDHLNKPCKACTICKLKPCPMGLAIGITWGLSMLVLGLLAMHLKLGLAWMTTLSSLYLGFETTPRGLVMGALWGLVYGFFSGFIMAWIYNRSVKLCCGSKCICGKNPENKNKM